MPLSKIQNDNVTKINTKQLDLEKKLQFLFERNLETILNIHLLAHEYATSFGGRIDTLGIDKDGSPVIIEYKKSQNNNVINQGLSNRSFLNINVKTLFLCIDSLGLLLKNFIIYLIQAA